MKYTVGEIAGLLKGEVVGDPMIELSDFAKIEEGTAHDLSFLSNMKYEPYLYTTNCGAVLVNRDYTPKQELHTTLIKVDDAYAALATLLQLKQSHSKPKPGISESAHLEENTKVDTTASIDRWVYVGSGTTISKEVVIMTFVYIGKNVTIEEGTTIYPHAVIADGSKIGRRCIIHSGAVIGADGFGFAPSEDGYTKIPQVGHVVIEDDVEIGANACVDRASLGATLVGKGVKIDNLVQVAHNVSIGEHTVIAAQSGIAGSSKVGHHTVIAGQVGIAGHLSLAPRITLAAQCGIISNVKEEGVTLFGSPAFPISRAMRAAAMSVKLPELDKSVYELQQEVEQLKKDLTELRSKK